MNSEFNISSQAKLVAALLAGRRFPDRVKSAQLVETHISWVLLAGRYAYKIKKTVDLGFLDFTQLEQRRFFCEEEIRLNSRLAPQLYLDVVPIGSTVDSPVIGALPAIEYAVRMRRFSRAVEMDSLMAHGQVLPEHVDSLASVLARFHMSLPSASPDSSFGKGSAVRALALQNFEQLPESLLDTVGRFVVTALLHATEDEYVACENQMESRRAQGFVRECHGDLHLGNIVIRGGKAVPFDGIEFDPALRWTDVICDVAFPFMDLLYFKRPDLAYRFLNGWLEMTGDYAGLALLHFFASYRAAVRAKVNAIRTMQPRISARKRAQAQDAFRKYLAKACNCLSRPKAALIITHGFPGSGKTTFSQAALERFGAIRVRSDVERKRLFGLAPLDSSRTSVGEKMYGVEANRQTYDALYNIARDLLKSGCRVIVDAAFLEHEEREQFRKLAEKMSAQFIIASIHASEPVLRTRIEQRMHLRMDASEADLSVLEALQNSSKPLDIKELVRTITFFNEGDGGGFAADDAGWGELDKLLS